MYTCMHIRNHGVCTYREGHYLYYNYAYIMFVQNLRIAYTVVLTSNVLYIYIGALLSVRTLLYFCLIACGDSHTVSNKSTQTCRASTQVTTTTLQKNLTAKIKWYISYNASYIRVYTYMCSMYQNTRTTVVS